jgi:hypothetical protein
MITSNVWIAAVFFGITGAVALMPGAPRREPEARPADPT